jgi:DNA-binding transcriptional LysR family regulator
VGRAVADPVHATGLTTTRWPGVEIRLLVALQAVAAERSFSHAAHKLGYTQSAVSGQILALERAVGARLLDRVRGARSVELTSEGRILVQHASVITARLDAAQREIDALRGSPRLRAV